MSFEAPTDDRHIAGRMRVKRPPTPYEVFMRDEGIPVYTGIGVYDVRDLALGPWKRLGGRGSFIALDGLLGIIPGLVGSFVTKLDIFQLCIYFSVYCAIVRSRVGKWDISGS